jgi:hypothetical protein
VSVLIRVAGRSDRVKNEEVFLRIKEQKYMKEENGRLIGLVTFCVEIAFYDRLLKEIQKEELK